MQQGKLAFLPLSSLIPHPPSSTHYPLIPHLPITLSPFHSITLFYPFIIHPSPFHPSSDSFTQHPPIPHPPPFTHHSPTLPPSHPSPLTSFLPPPTHTGCRAATHCSLGSVQDILSSPGHHPPVNQEEGLALLASLHEASLIPIVCQLLCYLTRREDGSFQKQDLT